MGQRGSGLSLSLRRLSLLRLSLQGGRHALDNLCYSFGSMVARSGHQLHDERVHTHPARDSAGGSVNKPIQWSPSRSLTGRG